MESPPKRGVWCGRQKSGENMTCSVLLITYFALTDDNNLHITRNSAMFHGENRSVVCSEVKLPSDMFRLRADEKFTGLRYFVKQ